VRVSKTTTKVYQHHSATFDDMKNNTIGFDEVVSPVPKLTAANND